MSALRQKPHGTAPCGFCRFLCPAMTSLVCRKSVDNGLKTVENPVKNVFRRGEGAARRSGAKAGARVFIPPKTVFEAFFYRKQCPVRRNFINFAFIYIVSIKPASH